MIEGEIELVRGSGNLYRDFKSQDAQLRQLKALLAAEIIKALDERRLSVRRAEALTRVAAADFSRLRKVKLDRFTVDRLMTILDRLGGDVRVSISVQLRAAAEVAG